MRLPRLNSLIDCTECEEPSDWRYRRAVGDGWRVVACHVLSVIVASIAAWVGAWWDVVVVLIGGTLLISTHLYLILMWTKFWCLWEEKWHDVAVRMWGE